MRTSKFINSIIQKVNPLELPAEDGTGLVFGSMTECYIYVMDFVADKAKNGWVDMYFILAEMYNLSFQTTKNTYIFYFQKQFPQRYEVLAWGEPKTKTFFRKLIMCLHSRKSSTYDMLSFEEAYKIHISHIKGKSHQNAFRLCLK